MTGSEKQQLLVPFRPTPIWVKVLPLFFIGPGVSLLSIAWILPWETTSVTQIDATGIHQATMTLPSNTAVALAIASIMALVIGIALGLDALLDDRNHTNTRSETSQ